MCDSGNIERWGRGTWTYAWSFYKTDVKDTKERFYYIVDAFGDKYDAMKKAAAGASVNVNAYIGAAAEVVSAGSKPAMVMVRDSAYPDVECFVPPLPQKTKLLPPIFLY